MSGWTNTMQTRTVVKFSLQANIRRRRRRRRAAKPLGFHQLEIVGRAQQEVEQWQTRR